MPVVWRKPDSKGEIAHAKREYEARVTLQDGREAEFVAELPNVWRSSAKHMDDMAVGAFGERR
jgi:hypothetical protein